MTLPGLEPGISGSVDRCLIHWATGPDDLHDFLMMGLSRVGAGRSRKSLLESRETQMDPKNNAPHFHWGQCVREVKELVSKTSGLCPRGFESRRCRFSYVLASLAVMGRAAILHLHKRFRRCSYGVTVSTLDFESSDRGSNPRGSFPYFHLEFFVRFRDDISVVHHAVCEQEFIIRCSLVG
jgi:hypothetical protein